MALASEGGATVLDPAPAPATPAPVPAHWVHRLARAAARAADEDALQAELTAALYETLGADQVHLIEVGQGAATGDARVVGPDGGEDSYEHALAAAPSGTGQVVATGTPLYVADARTSEALRQDLVERFGADSTLFLPLAWGGEVRHVALAVLQDRGGERRTLDDGEIAGALALADQAAAGLARLEAERRARARAKQDVALVRAARALNASLELGEVLHTLAREAALAVDGDISGVYLGNADTGGVATAGHNVPEEWHGITLAAGEGAGGQALATGRPFLTNDYQGETAMPAHDVLRRFRSAVAVPMAWNGELKGTLSVGWTRLRRIDAEDVRTLEAIADLATVACCNAETYEEIQQAARTDALTGLLNHGAMQVRLREEIARARRDGTPLACVILDLDDFKRVNDSRGHQAGDELLRAVAALLHDELRPYDQIARYGGDEFVLLLPGSDEAMACAVAERIRDAVAAETMPGSRLELAGACSLGVAAWRDPLDAEALLQHADRALMLAKRTGKGRVSVANADVERELAMMGADDGSPAAVQALAAAIEERDAYTREHSDEVVRLARGVAMILGLPSHTVERIAHAALLHDVGKLGVPHEILHKRGPLTPAEWAIMAEHPVAGERILLRIPELAPIAAIVRHEHEHWDGSGYPDRLKGHNIPIGSRIILACDAWEAMITPRPYRPAMTRADALAELRDGRGTMYDPEVIDALLDLLGEDRPAVPDRARGVRLAAPVPKLPQRRRR
jgi:diguanylate cyclase (GGDEF)-like protein